KHYSNIPYTSQLDFAIVLFIDVPQEFRHHVCLFRIPELREYPAERIHVERPEGICSAVLYETAADIVFPPGLDVADIMRHETAEDSPPEAEPADDFVLEFMFGRLVEHFLQFASGQLYLHRIYGMRQYFVEVVIRQIPAFERLDDKPRVHKPCITVRKFLNHGGETCDKFTCRIKPARNRFCIFLDHSLELLPADVIIVVVNTREQISLIELCGFPGQHRPFEIERDFPCEIAETSRSRKQRIPHPFTFRKIVMGMGAQDDVYLGEHHRKRLVIVAAEMAHHHDAVDFRIDFADGVKYPVESFGYFPAECFIEWRKLHCRSDEAELDALDLFYDIRPEERVGTPHFTQVGTDDIEIRFVVEGFQIFLLQRDAFIVADCGHFTPRFIQEFYVPFAERRFGIGVGTVDMIAEIDIDHVIPVLALFILQKRHYF